ncbi:hypothetical protein C8J57DRAFT_1304243 [Mycena rebaudengoi]|nr:hypothetical protein C8J57DRAFT_1304243 [Mycena rebaudengoi]
MEHESLPGSHLKPAEALAHASHHVLTEQYFADGADNLEDELDEIEEQLDSNPATKATVSGRMQIAHLLNPVKPAFIGPQIRPIPTFLTAGLPISRSVLVAQRTDHCAGTLVHSEEERQPETDSEGLRTDTAFQKGRYYRWIAAGKPTEWNIGCNLHDALTDVVVPNIKSRGITGVTVLSLESLVMMRSGLRIYLGKVKGIYRYGSVSGKHDSFTDVETVDGLSYLSLEVYEQLGPNRNLFQHISPSEGPSSSDLALFTHAPISELIYLLAGAVLKSQGEGSDETFTMTGGDNGWERWQVLNRSELRTVLNPVEDDEEYDEPEEGGKKRRPKGPRGAVKKQKTVKSRAPTRSGRGKAQGGSKRGKTAKK